MMFDKTAEIEYERELLVQENIVLEQRLNLKLLCSLDQHKRDLKKLSLASLRHRIKLLKKELETTLKAKFNGNNLRLS